VIEPHEIAPQEKMAAPSRAPLFVFIDLREDPKAWVQIESELPEDMNFPVR
jgi:hypothetical protein